MGGNISNSNIWDAKDPKTHKEVEKMFTEMIGWAVDEGADMLIGETFYYAEEAYTALKVMKKTGLPSVITIAPMGENMMRDGVSIVDACKELEQRGGEVVGMNCFRGPTTMMPYIKEVRKALKCHVAALPINYRTTEKHPTFLIYQIIMDVHVIHLTKHHFLQRWIQCNVTGMKLLNSQKKLLVLVLII